MSCPRSTPPGRCCRTCLERGSGYLIQNASAAGLLTALGNAPYATSKHAVLGLTEWLSIHYGGNGIRVSCIVAEGVRTAMLRGAQGEWFAVAGAIEPDEAANCIVDGMNKEQFLILTHPLVRSTSAARPPTTTNGSPKCANYHAKTRD